MDKADECMSRGREGTRQACVTACSPAYALAQESRGSRSPGLPSTPELKVQQRRVEPVEFNTP